MHTLILKFLAVSLLVIGLGTPVGDLVNVLRDAPIQGHQVVIANPDGADSPQEFIVESAHPDLDQGILRLDSPPLPLQMPHRCRARTPLAPAAAPPDPLYRPPSLV